MTKETRATFRIDSEEWERFKKEVQKRTGLSASAWLRMHIHKFNRNDSN